MTLWQNLGLLGTLILSDNDAFRLQSVHWADNPLVKQIPERNKQRSEKVRKVGGSSQAESDENDVWKGVASTHIQHAGTTGSKS